MSGPTSNFDPQLLRQLAEVFALAALDAVLAEAEVRTAEADMLPPAMQMGGGAPAAFDAQIDAGIQ